ncbi:MAG: hypothetical protein KA474_08220 [Acinetobacter sp.]|nr:hypothetical protein [Acinetobacter sp.]
MSYFKMEIGKENDFIDYTNTNSLKNYTNTISTKNYANTNAFEREKIINNRLINDNKKNFFIEIKEMLGINSALSWKSYSSVLNESMICTETINELLFKLKNKISSKEIKKQLDNISQLIKDNEVNHNSLIQCLMFLNSQEIQKSEFFIDPVDGKCILYYKEQSKIHNKSLTISFSGEKRINFNIVDRKKGLTRMNGYLIMKDQNSFYRIDELFKIF